MPPSFKKKNTTTATVVLSTEHMFDSGIILRNNTPVAYHKADKNSACESELLLAHAASCANIAVGQRL